MAEVSRAKTDPSKFLSGIISTKVNVKLHNGVSYVGNLKSIDGYMNIVLDSAVEIVDSQPSGTKYADVFIRGNNVLFISEE